MQFLSFRCIKLTNYFLTKVQTKHGRELINESDPEPVFQTSHDTTART